MDSIARSDIFFTVTTIAIVVVGLLLAGVLVYALRMMHDARAITKSVRDETKKIMSDVETIRKAVTSDAKMVREVAGSVVKDAASAVREKFIKSDKNTKNDEKEKNG